MPLLFEPALPLDAHFIIAVQTEGRVEHSGEPCTRVLLMFAAGATDGYEVSRYALQLRRIGDVPAMEQAFRNADQVRVWSCGFALMGGHTEGSAVSRLYNAYHMDFQSALVPNAIDQYTYEIEFHSLMECLSAGSFRRPDGTQQLVNRIDYARIAV
jgi:hypothetical protein